MYNSDNIIKDYNYGHSIDYIVDCYYKSKISNKDKRLIGNEWVISKDRYTKQEAREFVTNILYTYVMKNLKEAD